VFRVPGTEGLPRGARIRARVAGLDLLTLELHATLLAQLDVQPAAAEGTAEDDDAEPAGTLQLAIDVAEAEPVGDPAGDPAAEPAA
jgi:exoribonuclease-2